MQKLSLFSLGTLALFSASLSFAASESSYVKRPVKRTEKNEVRAAGKAPEIPVWQYGIPEDTLALFEDYDPDVVFAPVPCHNRDDLWARWICKPYKAGIEQRPMEEKGTPKVLFKRYKTEDGRIFFLELN
jgi:hypothetical protein